MRGGALPPALLCAALGLALGYAPRAVRVYGLALLSAVALAASFLLIPQAWQDAAFFGCWTSVVVTALSVHLPRGLGPRLGLILSANTGLWVGAVIAAAGSRWDLLKSLPLGLACVPAAWLVAPRRGVAIKVVASWLVAIAVLAAALQFTPTPGYKPDHMD